MKCQVCGNELKESDSFCGKCGNKVSKEIYCKKCGNKVEKDNNFCSNCGEPAIEVENDVQPKVEFHQTENMQSDNSQQNESPTIGILAIVFGALGGLLGLIFSIVGLSTYSNPTYRSYCKIGLWLVVGWAAISIIVSCTTSCAVMSYYR